MHSESIFYTPLNILNLWPVKFPLICLSAVNWKNSNIGSGFLPSVSF